MPCINAITIGFREDASLIKIIRDAASYKSLLAQPNERLANPKHLGEGELVLIRD
jgi:hypothetical protein